jgi:hypothetical protein
VRAKQLAAMIIQAGHWYEVRGDARTNRIVLHHRDGRVIESTLTRDECDQAGYSTRPDGRGGRVVKAQWEANPKLFLFYRHVSRIAQMYLPELLQEGGVRVREIEADDGRLRKDADGREYLDAEFTPVESDAEASGVEEPERKSASAGFEEEEGEIPLEQDAPAEEVDEEATTQQQPPALPPRPYPAETISAALRQAAAKRGSGPASAAQVGLVASSLEALFPNDDASTRTLKRRSVLAYLWGIESAKQLSTGQASALIDWATLQEDDGAGNAYRVPSEHGPSEAAAMVAAHDVAQGQQALPLGEAGDAE